MIVRNHDIPRKTSSNYCTSEIFYFEDNFETLFFFVVATVAGYSSWEGTLTGAEVDYFGTVEDYYFLVFVGGEWWAWRGSFLGFSFVVFFAEGSFTLSRHEYD
jgi:hypothetical protein